MTVNEKAREALLATLNGVLDEEFNQKPAADVWSMKQVFEHLYVMEAYIAKVVQQEMETGEVQEVKKRRIEATVDRSVKVDAPDAFIPSGGVETIAEMKRKLTESHKKLQTVANQYTEDELSKKALLHPAFKNMSLDQWIPFIGYHEMRHTEQVNEIKTALGL